MTSREACALALVAMALGCGSHAGPTGATGPEGEEGPQGAPGAMGAQGSAGPAGTSGVVGDGGATTSATASILPPGGRLVAEGSSCAGAVPVQLADIPSATVLCYVPYASAYVPVGGKMLPFATLTLTPTTAAATAIYDVFAVVVAGAAQVCFDTTAWATSTTRADDITAGADAFYVNGGSIATCENGATTIASAVPAGSATYLGSFYATAAGATEWLVSPNPATGGTNNVLGVYNAYNHVVVEAIERELTPMWVYGNPTGTWEEENGSAGNRITILDGLGQSQVEVSETMTLSYATGTDAQAGSPGICADGTNPVAAMSMGTCTVVGTEAQGSFTMEDQGTTVTVGGVWPALGATSLGLHFFQAIESGESANSDGPEWYGNDSSALYVSLPD